jgi:hypothetical protein
VDARLEGQVYLCLPCQWRPLRHHQDSRIVSDVRFKRRALSDLF